MGFNSIEAQKHLEGVYHPVSREDLASTAENNNASNDLVERLRALPDQEHTGSGDAQGALKKS